jgi:hypothetical protein
MSPSPRVRWLAVLLVAAGCGPPTPPAPTWHRDVAPIVQAQCLGCHSAGGIAPFALDTYEAAKPMAMAMASSVAARRMPPWLASPDCGAPFVDSRILTEAQVTAFQEWAKAGAPEGKASEAPMTTVTPSQRLARIDATLQMPVAYTPSATLKDDYRCFIVDPAVANPTLVTGYDILPGSQKVVHHVILYAVKRTVAVTEDAKDSTAGWQCFGGVGVDTEGALGAWAPGGSAVVYPRGTGIRLEPDQVLAMQVHYNTSNGTDADRTSVKLMYGKGSETQAFLIPLAADGFRIPPAATDYRYSERFRNTLGFPVKVWGFLPHMHTLGKTITMKAGGTSMDTCLVDIPRWDFHWQTQYFRPKPHELSTNESIEMSCSWDNPGSQTIRWGEGTGDEMCFAFVYATP